MLNIALSEDTILRDANQISYGVSIIISDNDTTIDKSFDTVRQSLGIKYKKVDFNNLDNNDFSKKGIKARTMTIKPTGYAIFADYGYGASLYIGNRVREFIDNYKKDVSLLKLDYLPYRFINFFGDEFKKFLNDKSIPANMDNVEKFLYHHPEEEISGAVDKYGSIIINGIGINAKSVVSDLAKAYQKNDLALYSYGIQRIEIVNSKLFPKNLNDDLIKADANSEALLKEFKATKIVDILKSAGKGYYSLVPHKELDKKTGEYQLLFWLNPVDQHLNNHGWFTLDDLKQWANNEGVIVKHTEPEQEEKGPSY